MLRVLLCSLFTEADLRRFLGSGEQGDEIVRALRGSIASLAVLVDVAVAELERRGLIAFLWTRLRAKFPARVADINPVAAIWGWSGVGS